jgi:glutaconyl-CoA/methylmalonyl-CoA decarboxylase subunit gamma
MTEVRMPKLGVSMEEGVITAWLVAEGAQVAVGEPIYLLATDKTENEIESPAAGMIHLVANLETTYPVGQLLAEIS